MNFGLKINDSWKKRNSLVCVGLDPDLKKIPKIIRDHKDPIFEFNKAIIDKTADLVCAYKPQIAYYSSQKAEVELEKTVKYVQENYSDIPVILDAKRNDIGSTAEQYAREVFERYEVDAVTVNPYMGTDSIEPFTSYKEKGVIILCKTSNPGGSDLQNLNCGGKPLYLHVVEKAMTDWNTNDNIAFVVGATYPDELQNIRGAVGDTPLLIPGVGAQGGDIESTIAYGCDSVGAGLIISSSRAVNYASAGEDFAEEARRVVLSMSEEINRYRRLS